MNSADGAAAQVRVGRALAIGPYRLANPVCLAPMAGISDAPYRRLCRDLGAGYAVAEMVSADPALWDSKRSRQRLDILADGTPRAVQIAGTNPRQLADAARYVVDLGAQIVDINMGCPAKKVCKRAAGAALLRDEPLVASILAAVVAAVPAPVTLKMRTGWDPSQRNAVTIGRIAEDTGVAALTIHGRTRNCGYQGRAEYATIRALCRAVRIPVIANGDITSPGQAARVLAFTGAQGVMIGRAAQGRPWLPGQIAARLATGRCPADPTGEALARIVSGHLAAMHEYYGEKLGSRLARKHLIAYGRAMGDRGEGLLAIARGEMGAAEQRQRVARFFAADGGVDSVRVTRPIAA